MKRNSFFWLLVSASALTFFVATKDVVWAQPASAPSTSAKQPDDSAITAAVQSALQNEKWMPGTDIHAKSENGVVTLSGPARSHGDIQRAVRVARKVPGVTRTKSQIKVMPLPNPANFPK